MRPEETGSVRTDIQLLVYHQPMHTINFLVTFSFFVSLSLFHQKQEFIELSVMIMMFGITLLIKFILLVLRDYYFLFLVI